MSETVFINSGFGEPCIWLCGQLLQGIIIKSALKPVGSAILM